MRRDVHETQSAECGSFAILILAGCSGAQSAKPGQNPETQTDAAGDGYAGIESGSSLSEDAAGDALEVDDILSQGQDLLNQTVTVIGQTPMSTIGDENGVPIGFYYQRGNRRIRTTGSGLKSRRIPPAMRWSWFPGEWTVTSPAIFCETPEPKMSWKSVTEPEDARAVQDGKLDNTENTRRRNDPPGVVLSGDGWSRILSQRSRTEWFSCRPQPPSMFCRCKPCRRSRCIRLFVDFAVFHAVSPVEVFSAFFGAQTIGSVPDPDSVHCEVECA